MVASHHHTEIFRFSDFSSLKVTPANQKILAWWPWWGGQQMDGGLVTEGFYHHTEIFRFSGFSNLEVTPANQKILAWWPWWAGANNWMVAS